MNFICIRMLFLCILACQMFSPLESKEKVGENVGTYQMNLEFASGRYIALDENYGTLSLFAVPASSWNAVHFLIDIKGLKFENSNWAASGGLGFRVWDNKRKKAYGFNVFYDHRDQKRNSFHQVGVGFELLSNVWELHLNGYLPVGKRSFLYSSNILDNFTDGFFATVSKYQYALYGAEFTGGRRFWLGDDLSIYIAPGFYYYDSKDIKSIQGIQGTAELLWNDMVSFKLNASYDSRFRGRVQGVVALDIPLGRICSNVIESCQSMILGRPVRRNDAIFIKNCRSVESNWDQCGAPL